MKSSHAGKHEKTEQSVLVNVARTIGSTLGTLAAKTGGATKDPARGGLAKKSRSKQAAKRRNRRRA